MPLAIALDFVALLVFVAVFTIGLRSFKKRSMKRNQIQQTSKPDIVVSYKNYCVIPATSASQRMRFS